MEQLFVCRLLEYVNLYIFFFFFIVVSVFLFSFFLYSTFLLTKKKNYNTFYVPNIITVWVHTISFSSYDLFFSFIYFSIRLNTCQQIQHSVWYLCGTWMSWFWSLRGIIFRPPRHFFLETYFVIIVNYLYIAWSSWS